MHIDQENLNDELAPSAAMSLVLGRMYAFSRPMPSFDNRGEVAAEQFSELAGQARGRYYRRGDKQRARGGDHGNATGNRMDVITAANRVEAVVLSALRPGERIPFRTVIARTNLSWFFAQAALRRLGAEGKVTCLGVISWGVGRPKLVFAKPLALPEMN